MVLFFLVAGAASARLASSGADMTNIVDSTSAQGSPSTIRSNRYELKELGPGVFQIGDVKIDKELKSVSFPAVVNLTRGAMEYFLVSSWGKVHESILRTDTEPYRVHLGMLLLGAKGAGTNEEEIIRLAAPYVSHPSSIQIPGDRISVEIKWRKNGKVISRRGEELVYNSQKRARLHRGNWVYNGSFMEEKSFVAQREGSIISLITDPEALVNNTGPGHDNDSIWIPNTKRLPPPNVPLEVVIRLVKTGK